MAKRQTPYTCTIGRTLRGARVALQMTQTTATQRVATEGVQLSRSTVSRIENGQRDITLGMLSAFSRVYDIDVLDVMTGALTPEAATS